MDDNHRLEEEKEPVTVEVCQENLNTVVTILRQVVAERDTLRGAYEEMAKMLVDIAQQTEGDGPEHTVDHETVLVLRAKMNWETLRDQLEEGDLSDIGPGKDEDNVTSDSGES